MKLPFRPSRLNLGRSVFYLLLVLVAQTLTGCSSELVRVDLSRVPPPLPGEATIYIIRPAYLSYGSRDLTIVANKTEVAELPRLSYTSFIMAPGKLTLSGYGGFFSWPERDIAIDIEDGKTYYLKWELKETASSALMLYLFPKLTDLRWALISQQDAQALLNGVYFVSPAFQELPR